MSTTDPRPTRKQKQKESKFQPAQNGVERLKSVVRRLPPNLPEEIFWQSVQAWVSDDTVTWKSYHPGKLHTKRLNKEGTPSRAYIAFKHEAQLVTFGREYDGHVFRDKTGNESHAVVEYAPFQKVPTEKKKIDARNNTIDKDEDYLSFLETLHGGGTKAESVSFEALLVASQPPPPPTTTPLLEALKAEKSAQKDKESILRNHAHYKDPAVSGSLAKKEEGKKKAGMAATATAPAQGAKPDMGPALASKKAKRAAAAAHKAAASQDVQGQGSTSGKGAPVGGTVAAAALSSAKLPASASGGGHGPRQRPPKEAHGRSHSGKGDAPVPVSVSAGPGQATLAVTADTASSGLPPAAGPAASAQGPQGQRKNRPVIGLGRHFEAALNGAGVAVAVGPGSGPAERKRRDKGGESGVATTTEGGGVGGKGGKRTHARREERVHPLEIVPSILQRPLEVTGPDAQRPLSPRGSTGPGEGGAPATGGGRGNTKRRGPGRGRSGYRGG